MSILNTNYTLPELLVPVGGQEQFEAACIYGADAVYLGGDGLNLRKASHGFTKEELDKVVIDAHKQNVQVFYTLNALPYNEQIVEVKKRLELLGDTPEKARVDALIIADPGVFSIAKEICPHIPIHLSTQAHTVNTESIKFWQKQGATRVNLARELTQSHIKEITNAVDIECEVFMHGAMCLALSGHCLLSMWANNRVANHGACSQPCRFQYKAKEVRLQETSLFLAQPSNPDEVLWEADENEEFSTIWSPHENCLIRYIPFFIENKVASLKIEGRTKSPSYVAQVTDVYRTAFKRAKQAFDQNNIELYQCDDLIQELASVATRPLSTGFFLPERVIEAMPHKGDFNKQSKKIVARVLEKVSEGKWLIDLRSQWKNEKDAQVLVPGFERPSLGKYTLENHKGEIVDVLHSGMQGYLHTDNTNIRPHYYIQTM